MYSSKKPPVAPSARNHSSAGAVTAEAAWPAVNGTSVSRYIARSTAMSSVEAMAAETSPVARPGISLTQIV
jgi:hypothetical protein